MPSATRLRGAAHRYVSVGSKPSSVGIDDVNEFPERSLRVGAARTPSPRPAHKSKRHATRAAAARADASPHDCRRNRSRIGPIHHTHAPHQHLSTTPGTPRSLGCPPHSNARPPACLHTYPHIPAHTAMPPHLHPTTLTPHTSPSPPHAHSPAPQTTQTDTHHTIHPSDCAAATACSHGADQWPTTHTHTEHGRAAHADQRTCGCMTTTLHKRVSNAVSYSTTRSSLLQLACTTSAKSSTTAGPCMPRTM